MHAASNAAFFTGCVPMCEYRRRRRWRRRRHASWRRTRMHCASCNQALPLKHRSTLFTLASKSGGAGACDYLCCPGALLLVSC